MKSKIRCQNMNHGRMNAPVKFCPNCGEVVNNLTLIHCDGARHANLRKNRNSFCCDCGTKLNQEIPKLGLL